jgi:hypothetical protein
MTKKRRKAGEPTRRELALDRRAEHHIAQIAAETTAAGRLRTLCLWLIAEAIRGRRIEEVTNAVQDLVDRLRERLPLPEPAPQTAKSAPRVQWYPRGSAPSDTERRHVA